MPIPLTFIAYVSFINPNNLKSFFWLSLEIPTPVSFTINKKWSLLAVTSILTSPCSVNLIAFDYKFKSIYIILYSSCTMLKSSSKLINSETKLILLASAYLIYIFITYSTNFFKSNFLMFFLNVPALI